MNYFIYNKKSFWIKIICLILSGVLFLSASLSGQQYSKVSIDSLETLLGTSSISDNALFSVYKELTDAYIFTDTEKSLQYARMGDQLARTKNDPFQSAGFYFHIGNALYYSGQPDSALYYYESSFEMLKRISENEKKDNREVDYLQTELFGCVGVIYHTRGKYDLALEYYLKALELAEKINHTDEILSMHNNIANTYGTMANYRQAEVHLLIAEKLSLELNDSISLAEVRQRLSKVYIDKGDYATALKYGEESLRILSASPDVPTIKLMLANQNLIGVWLRIPDYDKAMEYAQKTVEYARQLNVPSFLSTALYLLSNCYLKQEKYKESEAIAFEALATDSTVVHNNFILYGIIAIANIWMKNPEKGIEYFGKHTDALRAYSNENFQASLSEMEVRYETEKKEAQIIALEKEKRLITWISITGGGLLLLGLIALFFSWRWMVQKRRIAEQQVQLVATQAVFDGEVQERSRLARDLHDGLGGKLTGMKINLQELKQKTGSEDDREEQFNAIMEILDDAVQEMRRVSHNLMPEALSRAGLKTAVDDFCRSMSPKIVFNYFGDATRIDMKLEALVYRSIHELVNNALKYADASQIMVQIIQEPGSIIFTVQDDGCGFDPAAETDGIGLQGIRTRVTSFGGEMQIDSKPGEGTEINVELKFVGA